MSKLRLQGQTANQKEYLWKLYYDVAYLCSGLVFIYIGRIIAFFRDLFEYRFNERTDDFCDIYSYAYKSSV